MESMNSKLAYIKMKWKHESKSHQQRLSYSSGKLRKNNKIEAINSISTTRKPSLMKPFAKKQSFSYLDDSELLETCIFNRSDSNIDKSEFLDIDLKSENNCYIEAKQEQKIIKKEIKSLKNEINELKTSINELKEAYYPKNTNPINNNFSGIKENTRLYKKLCTIRKDYSK